MHRSGTSLLTSILAASGVDVGQSLVPADTHNRKGYFEDVDFLTLNRRILNACCDDNDGGHPDWGWTESESLDAERFGEFTEEARDLIERSAQRAGAEGEGERWGFKDPRSTLLLDFWHEHFEDPRYLLVYRLPWDVADSMHRLGADIFLRNPQYALRIWAYYNRHMLDFYRRHRDRALLVNTHALLDKPAAFGRLLGERLDLELDQAALERLYDVPLLGSSAPDDPLIGLVGATSPEITDLLSELDAEADLPADEYWRRPTKLKAPQYQDPKVSVVIPCRDHGQWLIEAVASVERSLEEDYELIIVDDGSEEERTREVMGILGEAGYRIERQEPSGLSAARNHGISEANADFILPLDADNRLRQGFIEKAVACLENEPELGAVYGEPWEFGQREGRREVAELDIDKLLGANYIDACALIRKAMWWDVGGYDEALPAWEDWDFWIRVATRGWAAKKLDMLAFDYRVRPGSLVSITHQEEVLDSIVDHVTSKHRQLFHGHLTQHVGHVLAGWPRALERKRQKVAGEWHELVEEKQRLDEYVREVEARAREHESTTAALRLELERVRIERLEAEKKALELSHRGETERLESEREGERARILLDQAQGEVARQVEKARLETEHAANREAERLQALLDQRRLEAEREAERAEWRLHQAGLEAEKARSEAELRSALLATHQRELDEQHRKLVLLAEEMDALRATNHRLSLEVKNVEMKLGEAEERSEGHRAVLEEIHSSRAYSWLQRWWRLSARLRFFGRRRAAKAPIASGPPVEDRV